jgi:hypothetical protein
MKIASILIVTGAIISFTIAHTQELANGDHVLYDSIGVHMTLEISEGGNHVAEMQVYDKHTDKLVRGSGEWIPKKMNGMPINEGHDGYYKLQTEKGTQYALIWLADSIFIVNRMEHDELFELKVMFYLLPNTNSIDLNVDDQSKALKTIDLLVDRSETPAPSSPAERAARELEVILQNLGHEDGADDFCSAHIPIDVLHTLVKDPSVSDNVRNTFSSMSEESFQKYCEYEYKKLKEAGELLRINWQDLIAYKFEYELMDEDGLHGIRGKLYFSENDHGFTVNIGTLLYEGQHYTVYVESLERRKD